MNKEQTPANPSSKPTSLLSPSTWTRGAKIGAAGGLGLALALGGVTAWALDRYVIDHVEIADVAEYEAQQQAKDAGADYSAEAETGNGSAGGDTSDEGNASAAEGSAESADDAEGTDTANGAANSATGGATVTDTTYEGANASIKVSSGTIGSGSDTTTYYVAEISAADGTAIRSAFANNQFGQSITARTSEIAEDNNAILAINGDYYGFRDTGIVIRNGVAYRDEPARQGLAIYRDGHMEIYDETSTSADELIAAGVWNTLSFGPAVLENGEVIDGIEDVEVDTNFGNHSIQGNQPRTLIGQRADGTVVFLVIDGRSKGYSRGATMTEAAEIMQSLGCQTAYNLDGGGSSTIWFNGQVLNQPAMGRERGTSDILYVENLS